MKSHVYMYDVESAKECTYVICSNRVHRPYRVCTLSWLIVRKLVNYCTLSYEFVFKSFEICSLKFSSQFVRLATGNSIVENECFPIWAIHVHLRFFHSLKCDGALKNSTIYYFIKIHDVFHNAGLPRFGGKKPELHSES